MLQHLEISRHDVSPPTTCAPKVLKDLTALAGVVSQLHRTFPESLPNLANGILLLSK